MRDRIKEMNAFYLNIVEELNDFDEWCVSERGQWGIPIPYFVDRDTGQKVFQEDITRHIAQIFATEGGSDAWYRLPVEDLLPEQYKSRAS